MKSKQTNMKAVFVKSCDNGKNMHGEKEVVSTYKIVDKKTEREILTCRVYMGRSSSSSTVYASIWAETKKEKVSTKAMPSFMHKNKYRPEDPPHFYGDTSGHSSAGGWGYHKESAAIQGAITSAGIELYGTVYCGRAETVDMKKQAYIDGVGESAIDAALLAIAYAGGWSDVIYVKA